MPIPEKHHGIVHWKHEDLYLIEEAWELEYGMWSAKAVDADGKVHEVTFESFDDGWCDYDNPVAVD